MKNYLVKTPKWLQWCYPKRLWHFSRNEKTLYLTFDDGPTPKITPWVLEQLASYNAKATFFCIGNNVKKHPKIFQKILEEGHEVGNHTYSHNNGWKTLNNKYHKDIERCSKAMKSAQRTIPLKPKFFRPPYGKLKSSQAIHLLKKGYGIVMWDVLSADFDQNISKETCLKNVLSNVKNGSVIVFHDSVKAETKLRYALPKILDSLASEGYHFKAIK